MSTDFIGLAAQQLKSEFQRAQDEAVPSAGDLERAAKQLRAEQDAARLRQSAAQTGGINPDQAAQAQRMARQSGLPEGVVERNPDEVAKRLRLQELDQVAQDPAMAAFFSDPSNLKVASDDLLTLRDIADVARSLPAGAVKSSGSMLTGAGELYEATGRTILRPVDAMLGAAGLGKVEDYSPRIPWWIAPSEILKRPGEMAKEIGKDIAAPVDRQNFATDVAEGLGQIAQQIAVMMMTGGAAGTTMLFAQGADQQAEKQERAGARGTAEGDAAIFAGGAVTAITERYGLDLILRKLPEAARTQITRKLIDIAVVGGANAVQELVEGVLQNVVEYAFYNPQAEIFEDFSREALAAGGAAGIMRTIILSASGGKGAARARQQTEKATKDAEALQQINRLAEESKLRERSPDKFRAFIAGLIEQDRAVDIDAQTATTLFQEVPDLGQFMTPAEVERLTREVALAQQTGADVRMPLATFVKAFVGTPSFDQLAENVRMAEDAPTAREAAEWSEAEAIEQLGRLRDELGEVVSRQDQVQNIYDDVFAQLKAAAVDDVAATKYAAVVTARLRTRAERLGRDPGELWMEQRPLIRRQMEMQGRAFDELDVTLDDLRSKQKITERAAYGDSLIEFLAGRGGLIDEGGELKAMDAHLWHKGKPGRRKLVVEGDGGPTGPGLMGMGGAQKNRLSVDEAARAAWEAGYFPELTDRPDPDALLQAIERELKGGASYAPRNRNDALAGRLEAAQQLDEVMQRLGLDPATATAAEIREAVDRYAREEATADGEPGVDAEGRTLEQTASVRRGRERLKKYGLEAGKKYKTREVAAALEARQREKYGTIEAADRSGDAERKIASWMVEEILFEVEEAKKNPEKSPVGWYSIKFQRGLDNLGVAFPELVSDDARAAEDAPPGVRLLPSREAARTLLTAFVAVTSDGAKVADNLRFAARVYENFRQTGKIDSAFRFGGTRNASMVRNIEMIARLVELHGFDGLSEFLLQKDSVGNLKRMAAAAGVSFSTGYTVDTTMPVSAAMFGPKLGAFWANLMGDTGYLTMDRWWSRTFNRYRGTLLDEPTEVGLQRFKELVTKDRRLNQPVEMMTDDEALALTVDYVKSYKEKGYKNGTEIEKAANTLYKAAFENLKDQPFNAGDRTFMIATTMRTQKMLARRGVNLTIADIQAVLWYYEKRLYGQLGARQTADVSYEDVAKKAADEIVAGRRVSDGGQQRPDGEGAGEQLGTAASLDVADEPGVSEVALDAVDEEFGAAGEGVDGRTFNQPALPDTLDIDGVARPTTNSKGQPIAQTEDGVRAFWRWFGDSKVVDGEGRPLVVYHGTKKDFSEFRISTPENWSGRPAAWFAADPSMASMFVGGRREVGNVKGGRVYPVFLSARNPLDLRAHRGKRVTLDQFLAIAGIQGGPGVARRIAQRRLDTRETEFSASFGSGSGKPPLEALVEQSAEPEPIWMRLDDPLVVEELKAAGYDSVLYAETRGNPSGRGRAREVTSDTFAVLDAAQIKSATGNRGTFDAASPRILEQGARPRIATWFSGARTLEAAIGAVDSTMAVEYDAEINEFANTAFGTAFVTRGVGDVDPQEIADADVTLFHASPVCKNFSAAKTLRGANELDRASAQAVARAITVAKPPVVTIENVPQYAETALFKEITDALDAAGYTWDIVIHDAAEYGAVQTRKRMLLRAVRDGELPPLPEKVGPRDWYEALSDLIEDAPDGTIPPVERQRLDDMIAKGRLDAGQPIITMGGSGFRGSWAAANAGGAAPTLKAANEKPRIILPDGRVKVVTPRMMARLMGLPDTYPVPDSATLAKTVLGNGIEGNVTRSLIAPLLETASEGRTLEQGDALPETIDVDGVQRPTTNSKGQPIAQTEEGVRAFWRWFGDSKVVDGEGRPLVVYHGTGSTDITEFRPAGGRDDASQRALENFRQARAENRPFGYMSFRDGSFFSPDPEYAGNYTGESGGVVYPAYIRAENPVYFDQVTGKTELSVAGRTPDALIMREGGTINEVAVLDPTQIKSATGNRGTFDPARPSILEQVEGKMPRGSIKFLPGGRSIITLTEKADLSTFLHELSHGWLEEMKADAQAPGAPADVRADWERIAEYLEIDPAIDEIPTEAHETFARTGEAYFMEGKAPSTDLAGAFARFKAWLVRIYRTIRELRVPINDDIRGVFDRMLATDEEIATVRGQYRFDALFDAPAAQGMTEAEFRAYRDLAAKAQLEAEAEVAAALQADAEREQTEQYREAREAIANEVEAQVRAEPVQRAIVFLRDGTLPDGTKTDAPIKLAAGPLREIYGRKVASRLPRGITAEDGVPADMVATLFGFQSGDELVRSLMAAPPVEGEIRRRLEARLREQFPDARKDGRAHEAAIEAMHGEARMRVLEAEFRALKRLGAGEIVEAAVRRKMAGKAAPTEADVADQATTQAESEAIRMEPGVGPEGRADAAMGRAGTAATRTVARQQRTDQAAARKIAVDTLSVDREAIERAVDAINGETKISDLLNTQRWRRAEKAAADAVVDAVASRNWGAAAWHQRQRIIAAHMVRRSAQARKDVEKAIERFSKYLSRQPGPIDADYLEKVRAILQVYQFGPQMSDRRRAILEMRQIARWQAALAEDEQARLEIAPEILAADEKTHYRNMTLDEFMALRDTVENLATIGRTKTRLLRNQAERDLNRTAELVSETILANVKNKARRSREAIEKGVGYGIEKFKDNFFASHRKIENLVREFDGFANLGPVWQAIFKPLQDAQNEETRMSIEAAAAIKTLFERFPEDARKGWRTRTTYYSSVNQSLSKATVISIALNWGNEGNREAIRKGFRWSDQQVQELLDAALTAEDAAFVQSVWDYIDTFWPALSALEKRVKGISPKKVEASPLRIAGVDLAGGYYPLKYDPDLSERAYAHQVDKLAQNLMSGAVAKASTRTGAAIERVGSGGMPVRLELDVMFEHVAELIHDISHREAILDVARLLDHPSVKGAVLDTKGPQFHRAMKDWVRDIAAGDVPALSWLDKIIQHLRSGVSISAMGWKLTTAMVQPTGFFQSAAALPKGVLAKHVTAFYGAPLAMKAKVDFVRERSVEMRTRANSLDRDIRDTLRRLGPEGKIDAVKRSFFYLTAMMDQGVAVPTWLAAYEVGMEQFAGDEAKAIDYADQLVRTTQSSGLQKDLAAIQRGAPTLKMFTAFYSYFSATYNLMADNVRQMRRPADMPRFVANMALLTLLPAVATELLMGRGPDEEDRDEPLGWAKWMGATTLKFALSGFVGVRDVVNALGSNFGYAGSPVGSAVEQAVKLGIEIGQGEADRGLAKAAVNTAGPILHLPSRQAWITAEGIYLWAEGAEITPFEMFVTRDPQKFR